MNIVYKLLLDQLLRLLTKDQIEKWAEVLKRAALPYFEAKKNVLIADLRKRAKETDTKLDDLAIDALSTFIDAFFPNKPQHF